MIVILLVMTTIAIYPSDAGKDRFPLFLNAAISPGAPKIKVANNLYFVTQILPHRIYPLEKSLCPGLGIELQVGKPLKLILGVTSRIEYDIKPVQINAPHIQSIHIGFNFTF